MLTTIDAWLDARLGGHPRLRRLAWFVLIYLISTVLFALVATGLHLLVPA